MQHPFEVTRPSFNLLATGNADAIRHMLASQLGDPMISDPNGVFRERAMALIGTIVPALVWMRDNKGLSLNIDVIRSSIELRWIRELAVTRSRIIRNPQTGVETHIPVGDEMPEEILWPLKSYLGELPGYDASIPLHKQTSDEPSRQHGFAQFYLTSIAIEA
jgi:intracellular multiplication protein IcmO